jgi:hypothetical protein
MDNAGNHQDEFGDASRAARALVEATGSAFGAEDGPGSPRDNTIVVLRINGPRTAEQCGHLTGPEVVYLHSAIGVHQCDRCAFSEPTRRAIEAHEPDACDSCGEPELVYSEAQFAFDNLIVTAYICDACREGRRSALVPSWVRPE